MVITSIAIDDEPLALDIIKNFSAKIPFLKLQAVFKSPLEAFEYLSTNTVDLVFLDIEMEEITGIQFLKLLKNQPHIIITSAYENYAIQGFELDVLDYLLKPFLFERFFKAVDKAHKKVLTESYDIENKKSQSKTAPNDFFFVKTGFQQKKVKYKDILYIEGQADYLKIVTTTSNVMTLQSFKDIFKVLPPDEFIRVHRSYIVAIQHIDSIERNMLKIGTTTISVSETYSKTFFKTLKSKGFIT